MTETRETYETASATTDAPTTLEQLVARVHDLRVAHAEVRAKRDELYAAFEQEHRALLDLCISVGEQLRDAEARLRELALATYAATGSKQPTPGVGIRVVTKVLYDRDQALDWAIEHQMALKLDERAFERIVRANPSTVPIATVAQEATATIANDLSPYVDEVRTAAGREVGASD